MTELEHLRGADEVRIIMVCLGNICRSPAAEVVLRQRLHEAGLTHVTVDSAGTGGWHEGDGANPRSIAAWERRGYEGDHRARQFRHEWFAQRDLILVMDDDNYETLVSRAPDTDAATRIHYLRAFDADAQDRIVPDPYYGTESDFEHMLDLIERACDGLVARLVELR